MELPKQSESLRNKAIKGFFWSAVENWGTQATQFLTFLILARLLAPEYFGLISLANIFIHFIHALIGSGFNTAIIQRKDLEPEHLDTAFWSNLGIGILLTVIGLISADLVAQFFSQPNLTPIIQLLSFNILLSSLGGIQDTILRRDLNFQGLALRSLGANVSGSVVGITMALLGFGVWSLVCQTLIVNTIGTILLWRLCCWQPRLRFSRKHFQDLFSFGINVVGMGIVFFFSRRGDDFVIGYFLGPVALGYYTVAYKLLLTITQVLIGTIEKVSLPTFSKLQSEPEKLREAFYTATKLVSFVALPIFFGMTTLAPEIVPALFGEQWIPSIPVMQILAFVGIIQSALPFSGTLITAMGKPNWQLGILIMNTSLRISAFIVAVRWGIVGVAIALVTASYITAPVSLWIVRKLVKISVKVYLSNYVSSLLASLTMVLSLLGIKHFLDNVADVKILLSVYVVFGIFVYIATMIIIAPKLMVQLRDLFISAIPDHLKKKLMTKN